MTRNARRPEPRKGQWSLLRAGASIAGEAITRNPVAVGGTTAFLVSLAFVSANALFYQPQVHPSAFVSTRGSISSPEPVPAALPDEHPLPTSAPKRESRRIIPDRQAATLPPAPESTGSVPDTSGSAEINAEETVRAVQTVLAELSLYRGTIDGKVGPQTQAAVERYRRIVGLNAGTDIDRTLLRQLGLQQEAVEAREVATGETAGQPARDQDIQVASVSRGDAVIRRVQAGLKAFGNDGIEIDGVMGERTSDAIREFQALFSLPITGEPDKELLAKMQEIGLIR